MKKFVVWSLACVLIFATGCGSAPKSNRVSSTTASKASSSEISSSTVENDTIPGIAAADIKLNLKKWIPEAKVQNVGSGVTYQSSATDSETGIEMTYAINGHSPSEITGVTFNCVNLKNVEKSTYISFATGFLSMCATLPYTGAEQQNASQWVKDNIEKVTTGSPSTTTIGGVTFQLSGGPNARSLEISKAK